MSGATSTVNRPGILIVEDDARTARLLAAYLEDAGFSTRTAGNGPDGLRRFQEAPPILVILDLMLPGMSGWDVCRELRKTSRVPVLILSARDQEGDRIRGLELGADDYVVKPFSPKEVVARVKAILRRTATKNTTPSATLQCGDLRLDTTGKDAALQGNRIELTRSEYLLLHAFMSNPGKTFSRTELVGVLYPEGEEVVDRVVDVHVGELRGKIESDRANPRFVKTVRGFGYRFATEEELP